MAGGGMNGGNGNCTGIDLNKCGKGQGINIEELSSVNFKLTPGHGNGNAGSGVLVNGEGPGPYVGASFGMGEGHDNNEEDGFVIIDIIQ